jgi:hypothetical protein
MNWWIDIELPDGSKTGPGPLRSATAFEATRRLDAAGKFKTKASLAEARASMVQAKRRVRCWGLINEIVTDLGAGIIDQIGVDTDLNLDISGDDLLRELTYRQVGRLLIGASGAPSTTGPAQIEAYFPAGWSLDTDNGYDVTLKAIHHRFEGESCLSALCKLAEITGEHFRLGTGRTVIWMQTDQPVSGIRAIQGGDPISLESNTNVCVVTDIQEDKDSYDCLVGRVYAYGIGNGDSRITLEDIVIGVTGWTIGSDVNKGYYLQHTDTWSAYGIERYISFKDISDGITLMEAAYEWMVRRLALQAAYKLSVAKLDQQIPVGSSIRVIYKRILDGITILDIDTDLVVLETTTRLDADGLRTTALKVATTDVWPDNSASATVGGMSTAQDYYTHEQNFNKGVDAEFLVLTASSDLPNERIFTPDATLTTVDDGAGGAYHIGVDASGIGKIIASAFGDIILFNPGDVPVFYDNTSTGFDAALAAAATGAYIHVPAGEITGAHSIPADVTVGGHGLATVLSGAMTCAGFLVNVQCEADVILSGDGAYFIFNPDGNTLTSHNFLVGGNALTVPAQKGTIIAGANEDAAIHYKKAGGGGATTVLVAPSEHLTWVNYEKADVLDNDPAVGYCNSLGNPTDWLVMRIAPNQLPPDYVISGFEVEITRRCVEQIDEARPFDYNIAFVDMGLNIISDDKADVGTHWPQAYVIVLYGSSVDDWNIVGLNTALINSGTLGLGLQAAKHPGILNEAAEVDYIKITVYGVMAPEYVAGVDVSRGTWSVEPGDTLTGAGMEFDGATGTLKIPAVAPEPPLDVASAVMVTDLNADLLDGQHASALIRHLIQDEGGNLAARANLNFVGAGVTATDDAVNDQTDVTIPGGGHTIRDEGGAMAAQPNLNFTGAGVTVTNDAGNSATDVDIPGGGASALDDLTDVNVAGVTDGQLLAYDDGAGEWVAVDPGAGGASIDAYVGTEIYRTVVGVGGVASIDIQNIPADYDELRLIINGKSEDAAAGDLVIIAFNNDTTDANYRVAVHYGGTAAGSWQNALRYIGDIAGQGDALSASALICSIPNYANTALHKILRAINASRDAASSLHNVDTSLFWANTAAINRITLVCDGGDFAEDTFVNLIGYKKQTIGGGVHAATRVAASPYNVLATDEIVFVDTDGGGITVNLPAGNAGRHYKVINCGSGSHDVTLDPNGTEQIYGGGAGVALILHDGEKADLHFETIEGWW